MTPPLSPRNGRGRFAPVHLTRDLDGRASVTMLKKYAVCPRSAYLYAEHRDTPAQTAQMIRGTAFHMVAERAVKAMLSEGEPIIPPELVKAIADEVIAEVHCPFDEHDRLREMSYRWASEMAIDPANVVACETLISWEVAGYKVRGKIDFAETADDRVIVRDWKTSMAAPSFEEIARKRPDGSYSAKNAQLVMYALLLAFGVPVREEPCQVCGGTGVIGSAGESVNPLSGLPGPDPQLDTREACPECDGRGRLEFPEPFPLASRAETFELEYVYPAIEDREGRMLRRGVSLTRLELDEYRVSMMTMLERLARSEETGDWPAVISDSACGECPCPSRCPIPVELRDHRGEINTVSQAAEAAEVLDRRKAIDAAILKELKAFSKSHGPIRYGADKEFGFGFTESDRITDKDAMWAAIERQRLYGEPFDRGEFVKTVRSTPFRSRTLTVDELDEEQS